MPSRNVIKIDLAGSYYHVYARGASKGDIFLEDADYTYFISLFKRYLSQKNCRSSAGVAYPNYKENLELLAYCLMKNHFHLYVYQKHEQAMSKFMRSVMTSYSRYFNIKYKRTGALFESRYKAVRTDTDEYLQHITRYIHLNPKYWKLYPYSSLNYYIDKAKAEWIRPDRILALFSDSQEYRHFLNDYEDHRDMLARIKYELADY